MLARLHVIIASEAQQDYETIKNELIKINPHFSISMPRPYAGIRDHSEFYITCDLNEGEVPALLEQLNNDWEGDIDECSCYGFNTKMFHPLVYCLEFTLFND